MTADAQTGAVETVYKGVNGLVTLTLAFAYLVFYAFIAYFTYEFAAFFVAQDALLLVAIGLLTVVYVGALAVWVATQFGLQRWVVG